MLSHLNKRGKTTEIKSEGDRSKFKKLVLIHSLVANARLTDWKGQHCCDNPAYSRAIHGPYTSIPQGVSEAKDRGLSWA